MRTRERVKLRRQAIEALLCAAGDANDVSLAEAVYAVDGGKTDSLLAISETYRRFPPSTKLRFGDRLACAAYLLIESSPALRREWFGGRR